ncbi:hypothetical protein CVO74_11780 [Xanthomonas prunicola]|uniref:Uncharacterized protein n=1 Tax=Xanthomonas prunicola TaxID=2053930 RepID=A0A2N3RLT6_9XANT|nr:hypothetical protein XpruCFBP8353_09725 [Xanthomonas prunicola]PKV17742.1 hypothetical protein XpruCFBP8354_09725 [Xanthomonas prunicola]PKV21639.1 hypothetical protein CVO74_11780 [Xanthomonas prunicola]
MGQADWGRGAANVREAANKRTQQCCAVSVATIEQGEPQQGRAAGNFRILASVAAEPHRCAFAWTQYAVSHRQWLRNF